MTGPLDDAPVVRHERGFRRELLGFLLVIAGLVALVWALAAVDLRLLVGVGGLAAIGAGVSLGLHRDGET